MDQIKKFFAKAMQQRFWILIGVAIVTSSVAWYMTQSNLQQLYTEQESLIKSKYSALEQVKSALPTHPNQSSKTEMDRIIGALSQDVQKAWEEQYQRQSEYMKWPDIGLDRVINKLKEYYPVELHPKLTYPDQPRDIVEGDKTAFSNYFDEQMPKLAEIIGVTWVGTSSSGAGVGGMGAGGFGMGGGRDGGPGPGGDGDDMGMDPSGGSTFGMGGPSGFGGGPSGMTGRRSTSRDVVIWPKASQDELLNSIRLWQGNKPDVYQMIYTQENVWILEGLFNIIAKTNIVPQTQKPATANVQAAVKKIEFIRIGAGALGEAGDVMFASGQGGMSMGGFGMGGFGMSGGSDDGGMMGDSGGGGATGADYGDDSGMGSSGMSMDAGFSPSSMGLGSEGGPGGMQTRSIDPAHRRYVDASFQAISGEDFRTKIKSESPEDAYFAVAKRVPVRMRLTLDLRRFQEFLANCGNEGLMLEVRQVRIGDTSPAGSSSAGGFGGVAGGTPGRGPGGGGGFGMGSPDDSGDGGGMGMGDFGMGPDDGEGFGMGPGGMGGRGSGGLGGMRSSRRGSHEKKIEVYGIVYLFYPVNIDRLGLSKVEEDFALQDSVQDEGQDPVPENASEAASADAAGNGQAGNSNPENNDAADKTADGNASGSSGGNNAGSSGEGGPPGQPPGN
jgi:hypothetical protein